MNHQQYLAALERIDELVKLLKDGSREPRLGERTELDRLMREVDRYESQQ